MSGGTKIFLAVFGLLLILLIVYYGFLGGAGPDQVKAVGEVRDPLTSESNQSDEANQSTLAQHENRPLFSERSAGEGNGSTSVPFGGVDQSNPFGLASPSSENGNGVLFQSQAPNNMNRSIRDPLLPTPQAFDDPLSVSSDSNRPLVQPHQPRRPQTTLPGSSTVDTLAGSADVTAPRSNAAESVHYFMYTVKANDTLSGIALDWFKDSTKWDLIVEANPGINPDFIRQGDRLRIPPKSATRTTTSGRVASSPRVAAGPRTHTVRSGDTLSDIAQQYFGTQNRWRDIYNANRKVIGSDPDTLHAGDRLTIPD